MFLALSLWTGAVAAELVKRQDASSTSSASSTTPSAAVSFGETDLLDVTTCEPFTILWSYTGPVQTISLSITNNGVDQSQIVSSALLRRASLTSGLGVSLSAASATSSSTPSSYFAKVLSSSINASSGSYTWESVNAPEGWYELVATGSNTVFSSQDFHIAAGEDQSCVLSTTSSSTATPSTVTGGLSERIRGTIAGSVIGGFVFIVLLVGALLFWRRHAGIAKRPEGWGGLGSFDSSHKKSINSESTLGNGLDYADVEKDGEIGMVPVLTSPFNPYETSYPEAALISRSSSTGTNNKYMNHGYPQSESYQQPMSPTAAVKKTARKPVPSYVQDGDDVSREEYGGGTADLDALNHKSSVGSLTFDKRMQHYLIPDPPQQR